MPARKDVQNTEHDPLLSHQHPEDGERSIHDADDDNSNLIEFRTDDEDNPRNWPRRRKMVNVVVIAMMAVLSPLASSMFTPGIDQIAEGLDTTSNMVIACTTGFVVMLGIGPLFLAPLSEEFGRRVIYMVCFTIFTLLQIPSALSPNIGTLIAMRTLSGFFGSVGIANGGGTISDMFEPHERAGVFGWYLLGPLLGPTLGPLFGGLIVQRLNWRWIFWILTIVCAANTIAGFVFLRESYAPAILKARRNQLESEEQATNKYYIENENRSPIWKKIITSVRRPLKILRHPIVLIMSFYQAIIFSTTFSIYTNMQKIYQGKYGFNTEQVGLLYLGPGLGFLVAVRFLVPRIDTVFNYLTHKNNGESQPEFRLPLANVGSFLIPISLFWFGWTVQMHTHWTASIAATFFYGLGQVSIFNSTTNYYIDAFESYAASAIAAGAVFRSLLGGVVPLFAPTLFEKLGYGWGMSVFGFLSLALAPAPLVFYRYGKTLRDKVDLKLD